MKKITLLLLLIPLLSIGQWTQVGLDIDGEAAGDQSSVVSLSSDGSILAIGAIKNSSNRGHVRIYENIAGVWTQIGLDIDGEGFNDHSGGSVSLNANGNIIAIGAAANNEAYNLSGHVRVFENLSGTWVQIGADIDGEALQDLSGGSVSINSQGNIVAIGSSGSGENGFNSGHVRIFENFSGSWVQIGQNIIGELAGDASGGSVSLNASGNIVAIGARGNDGNGNISGHVRVYENILGVWTQVGADIDGEAAGDWSGDSVALSSDGSTIAIGATKNDGNGIDAGHVRVYENILGVWTQVGADIDGEAAGDWSGDTVVLSSDGDIVAIGAWFNDGNGIDAGHVRVYENILGVWTQVGADIDGEAAGDWLGDTVALSSDGSTIAIGAAFNDGSNGSNSGHVRVYNNAILSIQENTFGSSFSAYPNPSFGLSKIQLGENYNTVSVHVFNVLGKKVATQEHNNTNEIELNTQDYTSGIYFIKVQSGVKEATIKLVVE